MGYPDIPIGGFIHPTAVVGQFNLVFVKLSGEIMPCHKSGVQLVPGMGPVCKTVVIVHIVIAHLRTEIPVCRNYTLVLLDNQRPFLTGGFEYSFVDQNLSLDVLSDDHTEKALFQDIERCIRSMYLKVLLSLQEIDSQENIPCEQVDLYLVVSTTGQFNKIELSLSVDTEIILFPEMNFRPAFSCPDFVSLDQGQIHYPLFVSEVIRSLDKHISLDITQASVTVAVVLTVFCCKGQRDTKR
jgi:hypothetical protein